MTNISYDNLPNKIRRLRWACRRGMLELDVLLSRFLDQKYEQLPLKLQRQFEKLLTCSDPEIFSWVMACSEPTDPDLQNIIRMLRPNGF